MAKGINNSVMRGKRGNSVLYKLTNSNNSEQQGERVYVANVKNPKTVSQAMQRMKMTPAVNFYRAFKDDVLDHSFEGVKYGGRSHAKFMKEAMKAVSGFPFMEKGDNTLVGGNYLIADGSLNAPLFNYDANTSSIIIPDFSNPGQEDITFNGWVEDLIASNPEYRIGDQFTFVAIIKNGNSKPISYVRRIVLNTTDTALLVEVFNSLGFDFTISTGALKMKDAHFNIQGFGIILSRPVVSKASGTVSWKRSSSYFDATIGDLTPTSPYNTQAGYEAALRSYMATSKNPVSDWYLNHGSLDNGSTDFPDAPITQ